MHIKLLVASIGVVIATTLAILWLPVESVRALLVVPNKIYIYRSYKFTLKRQVKYWGGGN